ncbi:hypothetical protein HK098_001507 [Nowakowskiella sp. JEL0407]|nr:hypothetical protein HK098_001507 [Nowakowskiella sp. JEL0407]
MTVRNFSFLLFLSGLSIVSAVDTYCPRTAVSNKFCISAAVEKNEQWVVFTVQSAMPGWAAIGVGSSMASADVQIAWKNSTGGIVLTDRFASGHQVPTLDTYQDIAPAPMLVSNAPWANIQFSFRRPVTAGHNGEDFAINLSKLGSGNSITTKYIWATSRTRPMFADDPTTNFGAHNTGDMGSFERDFFPSYSERINLGPLPKIGSAAAVSNLPLPATATAASSILPTDAASVNSNSTDGIVESSGQVYQTPDVNQPILTNIPYIAAMLIHGLLMVFAWNICGYGGVYVARYLKKKGRIWYRLHLTLLFFGTGSSAIAGFVFVILYVTPPYFEPDPHTIIGFIMMGLLFIQFIFGFISSKRHSPTGQSLPWKAPVLNKIHVWLGRILLLLAIPETVLGIQLFSPNPLIWQSGFAGGLLVILITFLVAEVRSGRMKNWYGMKKPTANYPKHGNRVSTIYDIDLNSKHHINLPMDYMTTGGMTLQRENGGKMEKNLGATLERKQFPTMGSSRAMTLQRENGVGATLERKQSERKQFPTMGSSRG